MQGSPPVWDGVLRRLGSQLPTFALEAWLRPLVAQPDGEVLRLVCPSRFHRSRVEERYLACISRCASEELGRPVRVRLTVSDPGSGDSPSPQASAAQAAASTPQEASDAIPTARGPLTPAGAAGASGAAPRLAAAAAGIAEAPEPLAPARPLQKTLPYTFASFVVGSCNALAREAALAVAQGNRLRVSPLYLVSQPGLGKTHLARAVVNEAQVRGAAALYLSAEQFTSELVSSLRARRMAEFKRRFRERCDLLALDDVQFLAGKSSTQLELFHTLEHLRCAGVRVVLAGDRLPKEIGSLDPALESRMASGFVAEIEPPDAAVRRDILRTKAAAGGVHLPPDCLAFLTETVRGSVRDLESALIQVVASASLLKRPIDRALAEAALRKLLPAAAQASALEPEQVIDVVAGFFGTGREALASRSRRRDVLVPRQVAMYLCRRYTDASLKRIGRILNRDHPSVANAIRAVERAMLERAPLRYQIEALTARLDARGGEVGWPRASLPGPARTAP